MGDRVGFATTLPDGVVAFEQFGADDIITLVVLAWGRWGGHPIEWNDEGFMLTDSANTEGGVDTIDIGCGPGDDLFDLLARASNGCRSNYNHHNGGVSGFCVRQRLRS